MSNLFNKLGSKLLAFIVIVLFVVAFRERILTDHNAQVAFDELMGTLPFAKQITDVICKVMRYKYELSPKTPASVIEEFLKLAIMASVQPLAFRIFSCIILKVPSGTLYEREDYMDGLGYRLKEMIFTIISAPLIAVAAARLASHILEYLTVNFGGLLSSVLGVFSVVFMSAISIIPLLIGGITIGTAILWRVVVTLLGEMAITIGIDVICLWIYLSIINGLCNASHCIEIKAWMSW